MKIHFSQCEHCHALDRSLLIEEKCKLAATSDDGAPKIERNKGRETLRREVKLDHTSGKEKMFSGTVICTALSRMSMTRDHRADADGPSDWPDIQDMYRELHTPLPILLPEEPGPSIIGAFGLTALDDLSDKAFRTQEGTVDASTLESWKDVLRVIGCWATTPGVRKLVEQHKRPGGEGGPTLTLDEQATQLRLGIEGGREQKRWSLKQLRAEANVLSGAGNRWKQGASTQHMALIANNKLLRVHVVTEADVEIGLVPSVLLGQRNVVAASDLPSGTVMDFYSGVYASSAIPHNRLPNQWHHNGTNAFAAVMTYVVQFPYQELQRLAFSNSYFHLVVCS